MYDSQLGRWHVVDPIVYTDGFLSKDIKKNINGGVWNHRNLSIYSYGWNSPVKYVDPDGRAVTPETVWDVINVGMGVTSLGVNIATGNWIGAIVDAAGLTYDAAATVVPLLPAGGSSAIGVYRLAKLTKTVTGSLKNAQSILTKHKSVSNVIQEASSQVGKSINGVQRSGKLDDVIGAVKETLGIALENPKLGGSVTGHIEEVQGVINGLNNTSKQLKRALKDKNANFSKDEISALKETQRQVKNLREKLNFILDSARKAADTFD